MVEPISVEELKAKQERGEKFCLLDVRSAPEHQLANLGGTLIPLQELPRRFNEIDNHQEIIVYCHHGMRSLQAAAFLMTKGFPKVRNLSGGIDQWSVRVDPAVPRY